MKNQNISGRALGFLVWFRQRYNGKSNSTYKSIAKEYGQCGYVTVRSYMLELEASGYVTIENKGKHSQCFTVNESKYKEVTE